MIQSIFMSTPSQHSHAPGVSRRPQNFTPTIADCLLPRTCIFERSKIANLTIAECTEKISVLESKNNVIWIRFECTLETVLSASWSTNLACLDIVSVFSAFERAWRGQPTVQLFQSLPTAIILGFLQGGFNVVAQHR
jgi:hypothetical protein